MRKIILAMLTAVALAGVPPAHAKDKCAAQPLQGWTEAGLQWLGPCSGGVANGLGVLKYYADGALKESFYGEVKKGEAVFGVVDSAGGFVAGKFTHGAVVDTSDRNVLIHAFDIGSKAARSASDAFRKSGNAGSAEHYRAVAERLANQMD